MRSRRSFTLASQSFFFEQMGRVLSPSGRFVICDDFLADDLKMIPTTGLAWLSRFQRNWHVHTLITSMQASALAQAAGLTLVQVHDLTPYLRSFWPPMLAMMKLLTRLPLSGAYWQNLVGGTALQVCIKAGWTRYAMLVWEKRG